MNPAHQDVLPAKTSTQDSLAASPGSAEQRRLPILAHRGGIETVIGLLIYSGGMCPKCGHGTRCTSKKWARCKKCGNRVARRDFPPNDQDQGSAPAQPRKEYKMMRCYQCGTAYVLYRRCECREPRDDESETALRAGDDSLHRVGRVLIESWERRIEALENRPMRTYSDEDLALGIQECLDDLRAQMGKHSTEPRSATAGS